MKCYECGAELTDDTRFCSYCGTKISAKPIEEKLVVKSASENNQEETKVEYKETQTTHTNKPSLGDKAKSKIREFWNKLSLFGKFATVSIIASIILGLIAFLAGRIFAVIIAVVWLAIAIVAILMKKNVIKVPKNWIAMLMIILSFALVVPYFSLFKVNMEDYEKYAWNEIALSDMLPTPDSPYGEIISNSESYLALYINKSTEEQYNQYIEACKEKGFTIDMEKTGSLFYAYNEAGYKLSLSYYDYSSEMHISLTESRELGTLSWSNSVLAQMLPTPESTVGEIQQDDEKGFTTYVGNTTIDAFNIYVQACEAKGFTVDTDKTDKHFSAKNADGYNLTVEYQGNNVIYISLEGTAETYEPSTEDTQQNTSDYTLDYTDADSFEKALNDGVKVNGKIVQFEVLEYKPDSALGINCWAGEHLNFISEEELDVGTGNVIVGRVTKEPTKSLGSWTIHYEVLSIGGERVEKPDDSQGGETLESTTSEIALTMGEDEFKGMNYQEAEKVFREMGFTKFEYETVETENESSHDIICYIEITEWFLGNSDFVKGDKFDADSTITFYSYKYEAPAAPSPVFYSTNDYETAKNGNSGVFSYRERGGSYDIYWIIDFDEGYVYYFTDGNGESFCDRLKIESGTLNDKITITYHDGGDTWSYKLHFKYVNHPETLIMVDQNGFDWEYSTTDLDDALGIRDTKTIKDY